jgi:hypothetical protein
MRPFYRYPIGACLAFFLLLLYYNISHVQQLSERLPWLDHVSKAENESLSTSVSIPTSTLEALPTTAARESMATSTGPSKIIVMAKLEVENTSWVAKDLPE